ncbi:MAG: fasciclin domain-containing protein [Candidatus Binatia bacterium]
MKKTVAASLVGLTLLGVGVAFAAVQQTTVADQNIVQVAGASKDHTTLVAALKAANYITSLQNPGPFTVFAPTNAAFDKLPKATLDDLMKPEQQEALRNILKYHVAVPTYKIADFKDGQVIGEANGAKVTMSVKNGVVKVNDATIIASIVTSNGTIHVIDTVLLPPAAK